jgi:dolichol-phosphate mannosyltransferase
MISIAIPIYNEEEILHLLHSKVVEAMEDIGEDWEVVYVNDGSRDSSLQILKGLQAADPRVVVVNLSRNWGHMGALNAGLRTAKGDAVVLMDGDLQDPPTVIRDMVAEWRKGAQVVNAVRRSRQESRKYLAVLFPLFYKVLGMISDYPIPLNSGIFGLIDRQALDSLNRLREKNRYLPGLRSWVGYRTSIVYYDRADRVGGEGKLSFVSRIKYAFDAICSFSMKPLRASFVLGGLAMLFSLALAVAAIVSASTNGDAWGALGAVSAIFFVGSLLLLALGMMGEYIGRIYDEVRDRPLSLINEVYRREPAVLEVNGEVTAVSERTTQERIAA